MRKRNGKRGEFWGCPGFPNCRGTRDIVVYPTDIKLAPGSPEQEAFWDWLQNGKENGLLEARAGSGKTYTIVNAVARLRGIKIGIFSFNNHIIKEMNERLQREGITWARGHTYNAFGWKCVRNVPSLAGAELFKDKLDVLLNELVPDDNEEGVIVRSAAAKLVGLCKCYLEDGTDEEALSELVERFNIDMNGDCVDQEELDARVDRVYRVVPKALDLCLKRRSTLDYDDQVWWVVKMKLPVERFDMVMVDEAQDTNKMQQALLQMACP